MTTLLYLLTALALTVLTVFALAATGLNAHDRGGHPFFGKKLRK